VNQRLVAIVTRQIGGPRKLGQMHALEPVRAKLVAGVQLEDLARVHGQPALAPVLAMARVDDGGVDLERTIGLAQQSLLGKPLPDEVYRQR